MPRKWVGLNAVGDSVTVVYVEVPDDDGPMVVISDDTWRVQKGDRADAYRILHQQCGDYLRDNGIDAVVVKASAVSGRGAATLALLHSAELRGVVMAAAADVCEVRVLSKGIVSKTYGDRKVDEYVKDDAFWAANTSGNLRKLSRETAMLLVAARHS